MRVTLLIDFFRAYARMGNSYMKTNKLSEAVHYFDKSLAEFRDPAVVKKRQEVDKVFKQQEKKAYINTDISLEEKNTGNEFFQKGMRWNCINCTLKLKFIMQVILHLICY